MTSNMEQYRESARIENREKEAKKPIFAAIYARTSSPNQRYNYSINEQVNQCWKSCSERNWVVGYVFIDECESGGTIERPKFQLMLERAKVGAFNVVVFWKLDRFCRSLVDLINVERMLRNLGVGLCSVTEYLDTTTSVGRFNFRNLASVGELEREFIGERARLGLYALAKEHKWPNPHPPLGYDRGEDGRLVVNEDEAKIVQSIFNMYLREKSMPQLAYELNKQGILTKKGKQWNTRGIRGILTNEIYIGRYKVAGVNDFIDNYKIVDDDLFRKVNTIRRRYKTGGAKRPPMPKNRRTMKIEKIYNRYLEFLDKMEFEDIPLYMADMKAW